MTEVMLQYRILRISLNLRDGILWSFFNTELSPFINKERWSVNQWESQGVNISNDFISALKKADQISGILFKNGDMSIAFKLKPQFLNQTLY